MSRSRILLVSALVLIAASCGVAQEPASSPASEAAGGNAGRGGSAGSTGSGGGNQQPAGSGGKPTDPDRSNRLDASAAADAAPGQPNPPAAGDQVVINGVPMAKEKVVVFLHIGHSNMAGRTNTPADLRPFFFETHPRLYAFSKTGFAPAKEPLSGDYLTKGRAGPGMAILRAGLAMAPEDAVLVSIGRGHDGSRGGECKNFRRGGLLYDIVMGPAKQLKGKVTFGGIFSMLVLMDIFDKPNLARAHVCTEQVAKDMREDLGDPNIPFIMGDWEMGARGEYDPTRPDPTLARAQLRVAQMNIARSAIVPTDMLPMSDDHHFDLTGYKMWGERAFGLIKQGDWAPWATPAR